MVAHAAEDLVGFGLIVVDALAVAPAMRGEVEAHDEVLFAVGCGAGGAGAVVGGHRPGEVADGGVLWGR